MRSRSFSFAKSRRKDLDDDIVVGDRGGLLEREAVDVREELDFRSSDSTSVGTFRESWRNEGARSIMVRSDLDRTRGEAGGERQGEREREEGSTTHRYHPERESLDS